MRAPPPPTPVVLADVASRSWSDVIEAIGTAQANESITLTAKITDTVRKINFVDGQKVDAGAVLIELTSSQQAAQLKDALAVSKDADRQLPASAGPGQTGHGVQVAVRHRARRRAIPTPRRSTRSARSCPRPRDHRRRSPALALRPASRVSVGTLVTPPPPPPAPPITTLDDIHVIKLDFAVPGNRTRVAQAGPRDPRDDAGVPRAPLRRHDRLARFARRSGHARDHRAHALIANPDGELRAGMLLNVERAVARATARRCRYPSLRWCRSGSGSSRTRSARTTSRARSK